MNDFDVHQMCSLLKVPRSSFYFYCKHNISKRKYEEETLKALIKKIWLDSYKRYGAPKITFVLSKQHNIHISRKKTKI